MATSQKSSHEDGMNPHHSPNMGEHHDPPHDPHDEQDLHDHSKTRLRKACDSCSIRKIKCDESGPPCHPCATLDIPCTWKRPTRRRGPPNRHAEAFKRQRLDSESRGQSDASTPSSPTHAPHALTSIARSRVSSIESICPLLLLHPLIDDYFTYIHPLVPIPHEPTFRAALNRPEELHDPSFVSLTASMIGALVISFPRKPRLHLKAKGQEGLFPKAMNLVERCHQVILDARGGGFPTKQHQIYDAATSYLLALIMGYSMRWRQSTWYFSECLMILRELGIHRYYDTSVSAPTVGRTESGTVNYIDRELGRRLFWVVFVGIRSFHHAGLSIVDLAIPHATPQCPYPPLPLEVDDRYITSDRVGVQPADVISELVGFNANVRLYRSYDGIANLDLCLNIGRTERWENQTEVLQRCLYDCKTALNDVPPELQLLQPGQQSPNFRSDIFSVSSPLTPNASYRVGPVSPSQQWETDHTSIQRRRIQYEIQKANIYITQLGTRSQIVDRYWGLYDTHHPSSNELIDSGGDGYIDTVASDMAAERELIVRDLLTVLRSISQVNMEPNGASLIQKIRSIASTLLDVPRNRKGTLALQAQTYLMELVEVLMKLERIPTRSEISPDMSLRSPTTPTSWPDDDDEKELEHWADIRDVQKRFAEEGGVQQY